MYVFIQIFPSIKRPLEKSKPPGIKIVKVPLLMKNGKIRKTPSWGRKLGSSRQSFPFPKTSKEKRLTEVSIFWVGIFDRGRLCRFLGGIFCEGGVVIFIFLRGVFFVFIFEELQLLEGELVSLIGGFLLYE